MSQDYSENSISIPSKNQSVISLKQKIEAGIIVLLPSIIGFFVLDWFRNENYPVYWFELAMFFFSLLSLGYICQKVFLYFDYKKNDSRSNTEEKKVTSVVVFIVSFLLAIFMISRLGNWTYSTTEQTKDTVSTEVSKTSVKSTTELTISSTSENLERTTTTPHTIHEGVVYDGSGSHICSDCSKPAYYGILGLDGTPAVWYCRKDYEDILEIEAELKAAKTTTRYTYTTTRTTYVSRRCEVCGKYGTHSIVGISGQTEYYCDQHYRELTDMYVSMFYPELY